MTNAGIRMDLIRVFLILITFCALWRASVEWPIVFIVLYFFTMWAVLALSGWGLLDLALWIVVGAVLCLVVGAFAVGLFIEVAKIVSPWLAAIAGWCLDFTAVMSGVLIEVAKIVLAWLGAVDWNSLAMFAVSVVPVLAIIYLGKLMNKILGISAALDRVEESSKRTGMK